MDLPWPKAEFDSHIYVRGIKIEVRVGQVNYPGEGKICKGLIIVAAADVGVYPREPALFEING